MRNVKLFVLILFCGYIKISADIASCFYYVGNEKTVTIDPETGRELIYLTRTDCMNTTFYPHNSGWAEDSNFLLFESDRDRPNGEPSTGYGSNYRERQLMAVNVKTGDIYWLASIEVGNTDQYGPNHLVMSSQYHADYAPEANLVIFYDMTGHKLYTLNLNTGEQKLIWHSQYATIGDPPTITNDGRTAVVYATSIKPFDSTFFAGRTTSIFKFNLNPTTGTLRGEPVLVYSYSNQRENHGEGIIVLNHSVIDPMDSSHMTFAHDYIPPADGTVQKNRVWYAKLDGSVVKSLTDTVAGTVDTHEIWGFKSKYIYFVRIKNWSNWSIQQVDVNNGVLETIFSTDSIPMEYQIAHIGIDYSENLFVFDSFGSIIDDYNRNCAVYLFNRQSNTLTHLSSLPTGRNHPRHSHPILNPDGTKVAFNAATGNNDSAVVLIELD